MKRWLACFGPPILFSALYFVGLWLSVKYVLLPRQAKSEYNDTSRVAYVAARRLPANTRLRPEYLVKPRDLPPGYFWYLPKLTDLQGRYLKAGVEPGQAITRDDVRPWPDLKIPDKSRAIVFSLKEQPAAEFMNTGTLVDVCPAVGDCVARGVKVQALICGGESPPLCHAIIVLTDQEARSVLKVSKPHILLTAFP